MAAGAQPPESALVVVVSRYFDGQRAGNGFVIGDGTLVVTCDHLVFEQSQQGGHRLQGRVSVFSPYLGQACDARILASDERLDLAVLEVPWKGHPALTLADANAVLDAPSARIVGLPSVVQGLDDPNSTNPAPRFDAQWQDSPVDSVSVRRRVPQAITLSEAGEVGPGWSGSAIVIPGTAQVLGCFNAIERSSTNRDHASLRASGPVTCRVRALLDGDLGSGRLLPADRFLPQPQDAAEVCSLALIVATLQRPDRYAAAFEAAQTLVQLRTESAFAHKSVAYAADKLGRTDTAREAYRHAVELDPNGLDGQILYAQFLMEHGDPNTVRAILEPLWEAGISRDLVAIALVNLWGAQQQFARCLDILGAATKGNPRNAYLWRQIAACRMQTDGPAAAIEPLARAVELYPERGPFRGLLARLLEMSGRLDEAELHFRMLLEIEPANPVVYCWLADFLSKHRPHAVAEALSLAEKALELPVHQSLPRETIEAMIARIRDQVTSSAASEN